MPTAQRAWWVLLVILPAALACRPSGPLAHAGFVDAPVSAVATQTAGKIVSIPVREGDRVKKGQLLVQLESSDREALLAQAVANLERAGHGQHVAEANVRAAVPTVTGAGAEIARAKAVLDQALLDLERAKKLAAAQASPPTELEAASARWLEAEAALDAQIASKATTQGKLAAASATESDSRSAVSAAQAAVQLARSQLEQTRIVAPFDGLVVSRNLEEGEWAAPGSAVVTIEDVSRQWVRLDVEETQFNQLELGKPAEIHVVALPGQTFRGQITQIGAEGDFALNRDVKRGRADIRTFLVRVSFDVIPPALRPGMTAEVQLLGGPATSP